MHLDNYSTHPYQNASKITFQQPKHRAGVKVKSNEI